MTLCQRVEGNGIDVLCLLAKNSYDSKKGYVAQDRRDTHVNLTGLRVVVHSSWHKPCDTWLMPGQSATILISELSGSARFNGGTRLNSLSAHIYVYKQSSCKTYLSGHSEASDHGPSDSTAHYCFAAWFDLLREKPFDRYCICVETI
jgi:hypothetical protein